MRTVSVRNVGAAIFTVAVMGMVLWVNAGPLSPPPGAVASTGRFGPRVEINATNTPGTGTTLFSIAQPGSYYLAENVTGVSGKFGILIEADNVTVDLMGFTLIGVPGSVDGIKVSGNHNNIVLRNGTMSDWGEHGVDFSNPGNTMLQNLHSFNNGRVGIGAGTGSTATDCTAEKNGEGGIVAGDGTTITNCTARENTGPGIKVHSGCTVSDCTASLNTGNGIDAGPGSTATGCSSYDNGGTGIEVDAGSTVAHSTANENGGHGIKATEGCTIVNCTAKSNGDHGIHAAEGTANTVRGCTASFNKSNGIGVRVNSLVVGNCCGNNGVDPDDAAGIHVGHNDNRIEGNNVTDNDRGIDVDGTDNIILKNTARGNTTNYDIVAGNAYGPLTGVSGIGDISGTADHPWTNFQY